MAPISWESQGHYWDAKTAGGHIIPCLHWYGPVFGQGPTWFGSTAPVVTKGGEVVVGNWGTLVSWWWKKCWYHCNQLYFGGKAWVACVEKAQRVWLEGQPWEVQIPRKLCGVFETCYFCRRMAPISQESQGHHRDAKAARSQTILCLPWHDPVVGQVPPWFGYSLSSTAPVVTEGGGVVAGSWGRIKFPGGKRNVATRQGSDALWSWLATGFSHRQFLVLHLGTVLSHCTVEGEEWSLAYASVMESLPFTNQLLRMQTPRDAVLSGVLELVQ